MAYAAISATRRIVDSPSNPRRQHTSHAIRMHYQRNPASLVDAMRAHRIGKTAVPGNGLSEAN